MTGTIEAISRTTPMRRGPDARPAVTPAAVGTCPVAAAAGPALIGSSAAMSRVRRLIAQVARTNASVLITGPSGTGKEVVARCIHAASPRASASFVPVNCGAIPRDLLESELFGHEKGAFTGAIAQRQGRFEMADGGSIFLDEIGDMPADMQVKLLRVLEERQIERVGGSRTLDVDVRLVSATHRDLESSIADGKFREDLFYRLAVFPIAMPGLAERIEDLPELVDHFARALGNGAAVVSFSPAAYAVMATHGWPGNVRELRNFVERASILYPHETIGAEAAAVMLRRPLPDAALLDEQAALWDATRLPDPSLPLPAAIATADAAAIDPAKLLAQGSFNLKGLLVDLERSFIEAALDASNGVVADAARLLELQRTTLIEKMRKYGIGRGE